MISENMNILLYLRVSSEEQISNFSLTSQEEACRAHALRLGYEVLQVFKEEGVSAKTANRPELIRLLEYCRKNKEKVTSVLIYRLDRLARNTMDFLAVKKQLYSLGIKIESASESLEDSPSGRFTEVLLAAVAQLDNETKAERSRMGLRKRFEAGLTCAPPLGYTPTLLNGKKVALPSEDFDKVKASWELIATGTKTLSEMAETMNSWGLRALYNKKRKNLTKQTVGKIFRNKFYCGFVVSKKYNEEIKGVHTAMISEATFFSVQAIISGRRNVPLEVRHLVLNPEFPLRGIVKCHCGRSLVAGNVKGRSKYYPKYWCPKHKPSISSGELEKQLKDILSKIQPSPEAVNLFTLILHVEYNKRLSSLKELKRLAEGKIIESKQMMSALVEGHMKGQYPDDIFEEHKVKLQDQILASQIVSNDSLCDRYDIEAITGFVKALLYDLVKAYEASDYGQIRIFLGSIFPSGLVFEDGNLLNRDVSLIYRISEPEVLSGAGERT